MKKRSRLIAASIIIAGLLATPVFADYDASVIMQVQQALNEAGFNCGTPDGSAGNMTTEAVRAYQEANGLTADGQISDELLASLGIGDANAASGEEAAAAGVQEETAGTNDADGLSVDGSKFDETMYKGKWVKFESNSADGTAYEIYIPEDWIVEDWAAEDGENPSEMIALPEEYSEFSFGAGISSEDSYSPEDLALALAGESGIDKISINGIDDVYHACEYEEVHFVDDAGSRFPSYNEMLFIPMEEGAFMIMGYYMGGYNEPAEGLVEKFMHINRNIMSSVRLAGTK